TKPAKAAAKSAAPAAEAAATPAAAERPDAARPAARAAPESATPRTAANPTDDQEHDEPQNEQPDRKRCVVALPSAPRHAHAVPTPPRALRDAADNSLGAKLQAVAVAAGGKLGRHHLAAGFSGEPVCNPLLQAVADLDPDAPLLHREQNQHPVVLGLVADA